MDELKEQTGLDEGVHSFLMGFPQTTEFLDKLEDLLEFLIPYYVSEGKNQLVIAVGCTGGHHRSVTIAREIYHRLKGKGDYGIQLYHRDIR